MATYVNDLRLKEIATGDEAGTWGTSTNTNLELIGEALGYGTQDCFSTDADATTTVADGATDPARAMYFKVTSSATLTAGRTLTIAPNTISRVMFIENATTGSQTITISQGTGGNVAIANGKTTVVYLDGAGSGAAVVDAMALVDPGINDTLAETLVAGNTTGGTDIQFSAGDNITNASGDFTIDIAGDITLDAGGGDFVFSDDGTEIGRLRNVASGFQIQSSVSNKDLLFVGSDAGVDVTALTLDMSAAGAATFNSTIALGDNKQIFFGAGSDGRISFDGTNTLNITASNGTATTLNLTANNFTIGGASALISGTANDSVVINEASGDVDFRVESNDQTHMLFVEAGTNRVGINNSDPSSTLHVTGTYGDTGFIRMSGGAQEHYWYLEDALNSVFNIGTGSASAAFDFRTNNVSKFKIGAGEVVANESSADQDFRVESDGNANMLFVDAGNNAVALGTTDIDNQNNSAGSSADNGLAYNLGSGGYLSVARYGGIVAYLNRTDSDGTILDIRKDGSTVGTLGSNTARFFIHNNYGTGSGFRFDNGFITPSSATGATEDNTTDLGSSAARFKNLYLSSSVLVNAAVPRITLTDTDGTNTIGDIRQVSDATVIKSRNGSSNGSIKFNGDNGTTETQYGKFDANGVFTSSLGAVFNEDSADVDFRVESNSNTHALFVDAGNDRVDMAVPLRVGYNEITATANAGIGQFATATSGSGELWTDINTGVNGYSSMPSEISVMNTADNTTNTFAGIFFQAGETSAGSGVSAARIGAIRTAALSADLAFATRAAGTGTMAEHMRLTNDGKLGIGTDNPATDLEIEAAAPVLEIDSTTAASLATIQFTTAGTVDSKITHQASTGTMIIDSGRNASWGGEIEFVTDTDTRMQIASNGDINFYEDTGATAKFLWSAASERLTLKTSGSFALDVQASATTSATMAQFSNSNGSDKAYIALDSTGAGKLVLLDGGNNEDVLIQASGTSYYNTGGNFLIGKTSADLSEDGIEFRDAGLLAATRTSNAPLYLRRSTDNGDLAVFYKDSLQVGSLGTVDSDFLIHSTVSGHAGLRFGNGYIGPTNNAGTITDNAISLGISTHRYTDLYLSGGFPGTASGSLVVNDNSVDSDFRVESNTETHALFVDAGNDRVGLFSSSPTSGYKVSFGGGAFNVIDDDAINRITSTAGYSVETGGTGNQFRICNVAGHGARGRIRAVGSIGYGDPMQREYIIEVGIGNASEEFGVNVYQMGDPTGHNTFKSSNAEFRVYTDRINSAAFDVWIELGHFTRLDFFLEDVTGITGNFDNSGTSTLPATAVETNTKSELLVFAEQVRIGTQNSAQTSSFENMRAESNQVIFNENSADIDFRVESDSNANMLFVDAGNNRIGVGTSSGTGSLHIKDVRNSGGADVSVVAQNTTSNRIADFRILDESDNTTTKMQYDNGGNRGSLNFSVPNEGNADIGFDGTTFLLASNSSSATLELQSSSTARADFYASSGVVFNEPGNSYDFRVESDTNNAALFVDASTSRVGINQNTPGTHLHIKGNNETDGASLSLQEANNNTSDTLGTIFFGNNTDSQLGRILGFTSGTATTCTLRFMSTSNGGTAVNNLDLASSNVTFNENGADIDFRVESDNNSYGIYLDAANDRLLVGRGDVSTGEDFFAVDARPGTTGHVVRTGRDDNSTKNHIVFLNPNGTVGSIQTAGTSTIYNTSSDARLKENIADADDAGELIDAIQVRQFDWITDGEHQRYGMVAQELNTVAPEAVSEGENEEDMMGVDYSKLVPMLVKEIQSLRARVAQLESN